ncbi:MAG: transcriptional repressor [Spirochaetaceae bacterium]|nr:transcriptional repressor [Spirochaetaceae bacterium]
MVNLGTRKNSKQRDAILELIRSTSSHPTAQWVYEKLKPRMPSLSLGTVYRNINYFRDRGLVVSVGVVGGEERFDGVVAPHPHLVCGCCGAVLDLPVPDDEIAELLTRKAGAVDFTIDFRKTILNGLCPRCAERTKTTAALSR